MNFANHVLLNDATDLIVIGIGDDDCALDDLARTRESHDNFAVRFGDLKFVRHVLVEV